MELHQISNRKVWADAAAAATETSTSFRAAPWRFRTDAAAAVAAGMSSSFRAATFKLEHFAESNSMFLNIGIQLLSNKKHSYFVFQ